MSPSSFPARTVSVAKISGEFQVFVGSQELVDGSLEVVKVVLEQELWVVGERVMAMVRVCMYVA